MKIIEIKINRFICEKISMPIRDKRDTILLLLETMKLVNHREKNLFNKKGKIMICIDKMSRIFYWTDDKIFSFYFPFSLEKTGDGNYRIYDSLTDFEITNQMLSLLISIFEKNKNQEESLENTVDHIIDSANDYEYKNIDDIWKLVVKLWYMEEGYIRYDYDAVHENGKMHPLYHLDVNYSSGASYKIGLYHELQIEEFKEILDITTDCLYLSSANI